MKVKTATRRLATFLGATAAAVTMLALAGPASALAVPVLEADLSHYPSSIPAGSHLQYEIAISNSGNTATNAPFSVHFTVPPGLEVTNVTDQFERVSGFDPRAWRDCTIAVDLRSVSCSGPPAPHGAPQLPIKPGEEACQNVPGALAPSCHIFVAVAAQDASPWTLGAPNVEVCGGGSASCAEASDPVPVDFVPFDFHVTSFDGGAFLPGGDPATQAGSHPYTASTEFFLSTILAANGLEFTTEQLQNAAVDVPPGLVGNPQAVSTCTEAQLNGNGAGSAADCPPESQVGTALVWFNGGAQIPGSPSGKPVGVYNMKAPRGRPALFGFNPAGSTPIHVSAKLRTGADYGVTVTSLNAPQTLSVAGVTFAFWGVPADPSHDAERFCAGKSLPGCTSADSADPKAFLSLPTSCVGSVETVLHVSAWEGGSDSASFFSHDNFGGPIGNEGCSALDFSPTLRARPTTNVADSPTGLDVDLHIPQDTLEDPNGVVEAHLKDATVTLPEGLVVNPSGANGLGACSAAEVGLTSPPGSTPVTYTPEAARCPDDAKVATVRLDTPLLDHPLSGAAYIATPYDNPFNSLLALYIAVDDPQTGVVVKLAGKVTPDPVTGQLSSTFENNPQQPVEDIALDFKSGPHAPLRTPATCGTYSTISSLTPWSAPGSGPPATPADSYAIDQGPGGAGCATSQGALPNSPGFDAGTVEPLAGHYSPFVVNLRREDGSQQFSSVTLAPPPGLVGKLAGTPPCSDAALAAAAAKSGQAEKANPSCPAASEVGSVVAGAGAGPAPYYASGKAYLTGPYKDAPLSLAIITPAAAGPFDLGTIVVRTALYVDSKTAQITAKSDPIPSILQGIPLDVRSVAIKMDKPNFILNPTSCDPMAVGGELLSTQNQLAPLSSRFQLAECTRLGFKPKMRLSLKGGTTRGKHPALTAVLEPRSGDANLASISVALPRSEFLDQAHIGTVCTRVQFAASSCPAASVYGKATVSTPLLDYPLTGPVYLRSSDNLLPDLVPDLRGPAYQPIKLESSGRTDSIRGGIRNTFDFVPDAPFTKLVVQLEGGKKGLLVNSRNICLQPYKATIKYGAHNGLRREAHPALKAKCPQKNRKRHDHRRADGRATR